MARFGAATHADLCRDINEGAAAFDAECGVGTLADGLVAVVLRSCKAHVAWVGDSRCYLLRDAGLRQFKPTLSFTVSWLAPPGCTGFCRRK
jgi:hypothetical protein